MKYLLTIALFCLIQMMHGTTYYVSNAGLDINNGLSIASAFGTLQMASNTVVAGDSVLVQPGQYAGFYHTTSGTADNYIVFSGVGDAIINQTNTTTDDCINLEGASFIIIEGFIVQNALRAGIRSVINEGVILQNNDCGYNQIWGILTGFSENILIQNNTCHHSAEQHGIYFSNSADNPIIRNNHCFENNACGIHMNGDVSLGGDGIISHAYVAFNHIHDNGYNGGSGINCDGVQASQIVGNLLYNNHASGISLYQIDAGGACDSTFVINNTVVQPADGRWALNITNGSAHVTVFNNILLSHHPFRGSITLDPTCIPTFSSTHNCLSDRMSIDDGETVIPLSEWQVATDEDSFSLTYLSTDVFADEASNNYIPADNFYGIDSGLNSFNGIVAPSLDLYGTNRPNMSGIDIGAVEWFITSIPVLQKNDVALTWFDIPASKQILLFSIDGKLIFNGRKEDFTKDGLYMLQIDQRSQKIMIP